jgi:putative ABC transport system permease protein
VVVSPALAVVLVLLTLGAAGTVLAAGLGRARSVLTAAARAAAQLTLVSLILTGVLRSGWLTALFVLLMFGVAALTSAGRLGSRKQVAGTGAAIGTGTAAVLALIVLTGVIPAKPVAVVPIAGIIIGGAMTATSLAVNQALDKLHNRFGEYEAALSLGLQPRDARMEICRASARHALIPVLDETRTVGLVTLPGAYVGVLLGGASPLQAGAAQLLVLISLLSAEALAVLISIELVACGHLSRVPPANNVLR